MQHFVPIEKFLGEIFVEINVSEDKDSITFTTSSGDKYLMYHEQECCEDVYIEDIWGDYYDLLGSPITLAEESMNSASTEDTESFTWTFYKLATIKGYVDFRWFGQSNGYYSESVNIVKIIGE